MLLTTMSLQTFFAKFPPFRRLMVYLHSWLGAIIFVFIFLIASTGLVINFAGDLMQWEYPFLSTVKPTSQPLQPDIERLREVAAQAYTEPFNLKGLMMPHSRLQIDAATFFGKPVANPQGETVLLAVDPYQPRYLGAIDLGESWTATFMHLHGELLSGDTGELIVAIMGLLTLALLGTGLYLWLPIYNKNFNTIKSKALRFSIGSNFHGFAYYMHSFLGLWGVFFVMTWVITGLYWSQPQWFDSVLPQAPRKPSIEFIQQSQQQNCVGQINANQALAIAQQQFPERQVARVFFPSTTENYYSFTFKGNNDGNRYVGNAFVWVNAQCGTVHSQLFGEQVSLAKLSSWMISWHSGRIFGSGQIYIVLLAGFILLIIAVTGIVLWTYRQSRHLKPLWNAITARFSKPKA